MMCVAPDPPHHADIFLPLARLSLPGVGVPLVVVVLLVDLDDGFGLELHAQERLLVVKGQGKKSMKTLMSLEAHIGFLFQNIINAKFI